MTRLTNILMGILIVLLSVMLVWGLYATASGRSITHNDLADRFNAVESQILYLSCLELLPDRSPESVASCQIN